MEISKSSESFHFQEKGVAILGGGQKIFIFSGEEWGEGCSILAG